MLQVCELIFNANFKDESTHCKFTANYAQSWNSCIGMSMLLGFSRFVSVSIALPGIHEGLENK